MKFLTELALATLLAAATCVLIAYGWAVVFS